MEIDAEDGSTKVALKRSSNTVLGRGYGFNTTDKTISRQHLLFQTDDRTHPRVTFQVLGKNPIWVKNRKTGDVKVFRKLENGEVAAGDWFCVSGKNPVWFNVKEVEESVESDSEVRGSSDFDGGVDVDVSSIDPVKEFSFLVIGHEFDHYPKKMLRKMKDWDWFLEEPSKGSDEDEDEDGKQKGWHGHGNRKKRRKHRGGDEDDEWTGESEEEKGDLTNARKVQKTKYHTRSKGPKKASKQSKDAGKSANRRTTYVKDEEEEEENEEDNEMLGGFIITDEEAELEEEEEEEEEFIDDDEDD